MINKKYYHVTKRDNIDSILEHGLLAQSGNRSSQINDFGVFLFPSFDDLETALMSWLGDEFEEEAELLYLTIELPEDWNLKNDVEFESYSTSDIPPENILDISDEMNISIKDDIINQRSFKIR